MKLTSLLIIFYISILNVDLTESADAVRINEIEYKNGVYYFKDKVFNGDIIDYYENETLKFRYGVLDGRLNGAANEFFVNGKIKSERTYYMSKLYGAFTEYFEDGNIKAKFDVKLNAYGKGERVENLTIGVLKKGRYKSKDYEEGIIYFLNKEGDSFESSEHISILNQTHYKITENNGQTVLLVAD